MAGSNSRTEAETLWVVGVGDVDPKMLDVAADSIRAALPIDARVHPDPLGVSGLTDGEIVEPHDGIDLARYAALLAERDVVLAITDVDVAHPRGDWAFGVSILEGNLAAVSTARLGDPGDPSFESRIRKESIRHAGHLLGMLNCATQGCVFTAADTLGELDSLNTEVCDGCRDKLDDVDSRLADESRATGQSRDDDGESMADESGYELTHDLVSAARFWVAVAGYAVSWVATVLVVTSVLEALTGSSVPQSDALAWVFIASLFVVAWFVYKTVRRWVGRLCHAAVDRARSFASRSA